MEELNQESEEIQQQLMANPNSTFLKQKDTQIRAKLVEIWKQEEVTEQEIFAVVNSIGALKAPGPDGIHASFYQNCWQEVKESVIPMIQACFNDGNNLNFINHTNIALIPKVENPSKVNDFKPISLCNVSYKILTKILVKRLRPLLEKCISKNQGAFDPGRAIQDNILIAHEMFSDFERRKGRNGAMAIKLDLEKAYDLLDWNYIQECLHKYGFHTNWIKLIMNCISSVTFSVIFNGTPTDDCLILAKATKKAARNIKGVLQTFSQASGQKINVHKSSLFFSAKVENGIKSGIVDIINIQQKCTIGRYLGIHNVVFWKDPINAKELLQKISNKLAGWKQNTLSRAGKLTMIKANIAGMPNHVTSCFKCPKSLTNEIDKQERNFLWGSDMKMAPVAWKEVCKPKQCGGLGVRPNACFNKAAIVKLAWKIIIDKNNWWVQVRHNVNLDEKVSDYIVNNAWNIPKLRCYLNDNIIKEIIGIPIPSIPTNDEFVWGYTTHGNFSLKSATWMQLQDGQKHDQMELIRKLWSLNIQPKMKFFGWLLLRGRLKTRDRLSRFGLIQDNSCVLCNEDNETMDHLFGYCNFATSVWNAVAMTPPID
ncbi:hypothetical protein ACLB2K_066792 [Fragaria x ananassa]